MEYVVIAGGSTTSRVTCMIWPASLVGFSGSTRFQVNNPGRIAVEACTKPYIYRPLWARGVEQGGGRGGVTSRLVGWLAGGWALGGGACAAAKRQLAMNGWIPWHNCVLSCTVNCNPKIKKFCWLKAHYFQLLHHFSHYYQLLHCCCTLKIHYDIIFQSLLVIINFGCRIMPDIVSKHLRTAMWSHCAVWFEFEQTPFPQAGRRLRSAALLRIWLGTCCFVPMSYFYSETIADQS